MHPDDFNMGEKLGATTSDQLVPVPGQAPEEGFADPKIQSAGSAS